MEPSNAQFYQDSVNGPLRYVEDPMDKWEYAILSHSTGKGWVLETIINRTQVSDDMLTAMDSAGQEGWQLAAQASIEGMISTLFFKRPKL